MKALRWFRLLVIAALRTVAVLVCVSISWVALTRVVPPPYTPIMIMRTWENAVQGEARGIERHWVPVERISPHVLRAVVAAEDGRFMRHDGIDWKAMEDAMRYNRLHKGRKVRGASTITMQTAKNVFLWHGRNYVRKGLEAWFTLLIEHLWGKRRILEVYVNTIEMGDGIYGIEAASLAYFGKSAADLTRRQAALIAAVLPNPRRWSPAHPTSYINRRADWIQARMGGVVIPK